MKTRRRSFALDPAQMKYLKVGAAMLRVSTGEFLRRIIDERRGLPAPGIALADMPKASPFYPGARPKRSSP